MTKNTCIQLRITHEEKDTWVSQADAQGKSLSEWVRNQCNNAKLSERGYSPQVTDTQELTPNPSGVHPGCTPEIPATIIFFHNGNAAVCDGIGQQIPKYQGTHDQAIKFLREDGIDWSTLEVVGSHR